MQAGGAPELGPEVSRLREAFQRRTGAYRPDDPGTDVDARTRAFWDDALTGGLARKAAALAADAPAMDALVPALERAHRGLFVVEGIEGGEAHLDDLWSGAELLVRILDETQRLALAHAEGAFDGRVVAPAGGTLFLLPGAFHHPLDASPHIAAVLDAARDHGLPSRDVLDALLRMERVLRTSSRVKAAYAYRTSELVKSAPSTHGAQGAR